MSNDNLENITIQDRYLYIFLIYREHVIVIGFRTNIMYQNIIYVWFEEVVCSEKLCTASGLKNTVIYLS